MPHNADFIGKLRIKLIWYKRDTSLNHILFAAKGYFFVQHEQVNFEYELPTQSPCFGRLSCMRTDWHTSSQICIACCVLSAVAESPG